jgi:hypothetical protein
MTEKSRQTQNEEDLAQAEKFVKALLQKLQKQLMENDIHLTALKPQLKLKVEEYKTALSNQVELGIAVAEQQAILETILKKRNPSKRYEKR